MPELKRVGRKSASKLEPGDFIRLRSVRGPFQLWRINRNGPCETMERDEARRFVEPLASLRDHPDDGGFILLPRSHRFTVYREED